MPVVVRSAEFVRDVPSALLLSTLCCCCCCCCCSTFAWLCSCILMGAFDARTWEDANNCDVTSFVMSSERLLSKFVATISFTRDDTLLGHFDSSVGEIKRKNNASIKMSIREVEERGEKRGRGRGRGRKWDSLSHRNREEHAVVIFHYTHTLSVSPPIDKSTLLVRLAASEHTRELNQSTTQTQEERKRKNIKERGRERERCTHSGGRGRRVK